MKLTNSRNTLLAPLYLPSGAEVGDEGGGEGRGGGEDEGGGGGEEDGYCNQTTWNRME